jgi:outer membrane receptor protein involved in Fe transport
MRYVLIFIFQVLYISLSSQNESVQVGGNIFDNQTQKPLSEVQVILHNKIVGVSDFNGLFEFSCDTGSIRLTFILFGYQTATISITEYSDLNEDISIGLEPVTNELNEVVVSADKTEKPVSELSVSMTIIKSFEVTKNHIVNAEEIIKQTQGIEVIDGQASMRGGSGFSYGAGSRVLALIDGLPAISADAGNIRWQFLPLENLAQIEIIKGASSVLYGSSALNGIINFISASVDTVPQIKYSLTSGIYDSPKRREWIWWDTPRMYSAGSCSFSQRINNTEISIAGYGLLDNGYRKLNDEILARVHFSIRQHSRKFKGLSYGTRLLGGYDQATGFVLWENANTGALKQNVATATEMDAFYFTFDPFISFDVGDLMTHDLRMRLQISDNYYPDNTSNNSRALSNYTEYRFHRQFFKQAHMIFGISNFLSKITSEFYGNHNGNNISAYTQLEYAFFTKLRLSAGIRMEYNALDNVSDKIVPIFRSGINYQLGRGTFLRASYGQGYRYPSIAEKFAYTSLGNVKIFPNQEVRPEFGWSSEIGLKQGIKYKKLTGQFDIACFYSENTDMIEYVFGLFQDPQSLEFDFGFRSSNIENSRIYGVEPELLLKRTFVNLHLNFGGGYTYMYPVELKKTGGSETDSFLKYRKKNTAKLFINANLKKFELGITGFYKSKVLAIDDVFLNPLTRESLLPGFYEYWLNDNKWYVVGDVYLSYRLTEHLKFSFSVKNIGNTEYADRPGNIMPQRFYSIQLSGRF